MEIMVQIDRKDVLTPLGIVHLAGFRMEQSHREVIFKILSDATGVSVSANNLHESKEQPRPTFDCLDFDVNWTHSGRYCVVAYGDPGIRVGVDLERHSPRHVHLAERFFNGAEVAWLRDCSCSESNSQEFFRLWCRKEALYKCVGGSFFEDTLRCSVLDSPMSTRASGEMQTVYFTDLDGSRFAENEKGAGFPASLCIAVTKKL